MWWQAVSALGTLVFAIPAVVIGVLAFRRSSHAEDVERRVRDIEVEAASRVRAAEVGLEYMKTSLTALQDQNLRQQGEIGELRGQLTDCRDERRVQDARIAELEGRIP